jgi:hypothetical protein
MRSNGAKLFAALKFVRLNSIIALIEKGLEIEKLEHQATKDPKTYERIYDGEIFLTFLHFRRLN